LIHTDLITDGTLAPETPGATDIGLFSGDASGSIMCGPTSEILLDAAGPLPAEYDRLVNFRDFACDGSFHFGFTGGYVPDGGEIFAVVSVVAGGSVSGEFDSVNIEQISPTGPAHLVYTPTEVRIVMCYVDCDGSDVLDIFDFLCFGNRFTAGDPYACDCDTSTGPNVCDIFDFLCFGNKFSAGCP
jgi:hypothetical protein